VKKICWISLLLILLSLQFNCAPPPPLEEKPLPVPIESPLVRIGLAENLTSLEFTSNGKIEIYDQDQLIANILGWDQKWVVDIRNTQPATIVYRLRYLETLDGRDALEKYQSLKSQGLPVVLERIKKRIFHDAALQTRTFYWILHQSEFENQDEVYRHQWQRNDKSKGVAQPLIKTPPQGELIITNRESGDQYRASRIMTIRGEQFSLTLPAGEGYHFEQQLTRRYHDQLNLVIDRFGKLTVVNIIPIETYLIGVVGSEMQEKFPLEALKAQAVAARCYTIAQIGKQHQLSPFDLCDEVHCHVYGGIDRESPRVSQAVAQTHGRVLIHSNKICDTFYAGVCGGHSENNENVWPGEPQIYLQGRPDANIKKFPADFFKDESNVRRWIESSPNVFCNTQQGDVPDYLNYTVKYFRWSQRYSQHEISQIIRRKTGENIGRLLEIVPVERGVSGRLKKIEFIGDKKKIIIEGELNIRKSLSDNYLYSSCFVIDREGSEFIIKGAGWGHGVGMCQTGAAMRALEGHSYQKILKHYYQHAELVKLY